jgi:hypothetical protein
LKRARREIERNPEFFRNAAQQLRRPQQRADDRAGQGEVTEVSEILQNERGVAAEEAKERAENVKSVRKTGKLPESTASNLFDLYTRSLRAVAPLVPVVGPAFKQFGPADVAELAEEQFVSGPRLRQAQEDIRTVNQVTRRNQRPAAAGASNENQDSGRESFIEYNYGTVNVGPDRRFETTDRIGY